MNFWLRIVPFTFVLAVAAMTGICVGQAPATEKKIYNETANAHAEIKEALKKPERNISA